MLPITKKQISQNYTKRDTTPIYIVIHDTDNSDAGANAAMHFKYFNEANQGASADFFVDDKSIWQVNDYNTYYTWHCGDGGGKYGITNRNSIGIEICVNSDGDYNTAVQNAVELTKYLMNVLNIPISKVVRHYDASRKECPASMMGNNWAGWNNFKNSIVTASGISASAGSNAPNSGTTGSTVATTSQSTQGGHVINISDAVMADRPIYNNVQQLEGIQANPKDMKTVNFKQDYVVIIRKKLYYAISAQDEEKYLRVYQVNNCVSIRLSHNVYSTPATCSLVLKGAERVICAENQEAKDKNWQNWEELLRGWVQDNSQGEDHKDWRIGKESFELPGSAGTDFKTLLKTREAKYGWKFAEKCDWKPMDEVYVFGKSHNKKYRNPNGEYEYLPLFFGFIDSVSKTFTAGSGGPVINISASDQLKLMQLSRVTNMPSKMPGVNSGGGLDIRWNFPQDDIGCFAIMDDFINGNNSENNVVYGTLQNVFAGQMPYEFINRLALDAGIPQKYLTKRIEKITKIPFLPKPANSSSGDLFNAELKERLQVCKEAAEKLMVEFFADECGNLVFKIPNYAIGINRLKDNNMGYTYRQDIMDATDAYYVDMNGNRVDLAKIQKENQAAANAGQTPEKPEIVKTANAIEYKVVSGDTLGKIAAKYLGNSNQYMKIYNDNKSVIGNNPNIIKPGQILKIYNVDPNNTQTTKAGEKQATADSVAELQKKLLKDNKIKLVQGDALSYLTDELIPEIPPEDILSFTLTDTDREIYNMYEVQMEVPLVEFANTPQAIKRVIPDYDSIVQLGLRPHPSVINTPLVSSRQEAEYFGTMMICKSLANRFSGSLSMIEESSIHVGDPVRFFTYDEHPYKETGYFPDYQAQSIFYVVGIERNISFQNYSTMSLRLTSGRMMGQESIFDIFMPLYKYYFEEQEKVDFNFNTETLNVEPSIPYTAIAGDTINKIITKQLYISPNDGTKFNDLITRIVKLNKEYFGGSTATPNPGDTLQAGHVFYLPKNP